MPPSAPSPGIFISYRRDDSAGFAGRLYDRLAQRFGAQRVFMDIDTIHPGHEFAADIERALSECSACIVLIGRGWGSVTLPDGGRRLDDPTDFVRLEVAAAIRRGVAVFPVLVDGATPPPAASLPEEIRAVSGRQAIELSNERWNYDVGRLLLALDEVVAQRGRRLGSRPRPGKLPAMLVGAAVLLSVAGIVAWITTRGTTAASTAPTTSAPTSAPPPPTAQLSGTYDVKMTLKTFTKGTLGNAALWGEHNPKRGSTGDHWSSQEWAFRPEGSSIRWMITTPGKDLRLTGSAGVYVDKTSNHADCSGGGQPPVVRDLRLQGSPTDGQGNYTSFDGTLTISWACHPPFVGVFDVTGTRRG